MAAETGQAAKAWHQEWICVIQRERKSAHHREAELRALLHVELGDAEVVAAQRAGGLLRGAVVGAWA